MRLMLSNSATIRVLSLGVCIAVLWSAEAPIANAQAVGLPLPRLLTTMPMGGKAGSKVEIRITGENLDDVDRMAFSDSRIVASPKLDVAGRPEPNKYVVTIAPDCPIGVYECRLMTRLGVSSSRVFTVGRLLEVLQTTANTSRDTAMDLKLNTVCNATTTSRAVDHFAFEAKKGSRVVVECAAHGIDSKLDAVLIVADAAGRVLSTERGGGAIDFLVPAEGRYLVKVHDLTYKGGPECFYRLGVSEPAIGAPIVRMPSTRPVNSFSWPPAGLPGQAAVAEIEPNNNPAKAQKITLPCDIAGSFFPAADVDYFEFNAKKGEVWWVEVASERLGLPTAPSVVAQYIDRSAGVDRPIDVAEFTDIPSPVKVSSNGYAYDGPPYNAGTLDVLGKLEIKNDGLHRLRLCDLFGGTRNDSRNVYRLVVRKAAPDFALVAWALHMELRNGDRNALSKPLSLRGGGTVALEVVVVRRDGFNGDIELAMDGLPKGVTARGLKIPSGKSRGMMLLTAEQDAPRAYANANFYGSAKINGVIVKRPCRLASMAWPIPDSWNDIPMPRLLADVPVSVSGFDLAPLTIAPATKETLQAKVGQKLSIPLLLTRRSELSGSTIQLKALGSGFERAPAFDVLLTADKSQAVLDLSKLRTPPGDYLIAFHGGAVTKYRHIPEAVTAAKEEHRIVDRELNALAAELKKLADQAKIAPPKDKPKMEQALLAVATKHKSMTAKMTAAADRLKRATDAAAPKEIVDIVVSQPIAIHINPMEKK